MDNHLLLDTVWHVRELGAAVGGLAGTQPVALAPAAARTEPVNRPNCTVAKLVPARAPFLRDAHQGGRDLGLAWRAESERDDASRAENARINEAGRKHH